MASRYWVGGGSSANWSATGNTNWSATTGGANNASVPGSSDDVFFDGAGGGNSASTISATITILSLTFTAGYTNTVTVNAVPTIAGNFTDNTAHSWAGSSGLTISATSTITSGGKTWPNSVTFSGANTKTLSGDWTIGGTLTISTSTTTVNSGTLNIAGGLNHSAGAVTGTTTFNFNGTGTWTGSAGSATLSNPVIINTAGTITFATSVGMAGGSLTYTAGTVVTTGNNFILSGSVTLNTAGINFNLITFASGAGTITNNSLLTATTLSVSASVSVTFAGTAGFISSSFTVLNIDARTITLVNGVTYTVTGSLDLSTSRKGGIVLITSDHASNRANLTLYNGAINNVLASFTRIDASGGRPIASFNGTITDSKNITAYTDIQIPPVKYRRGLGRRLTLTNRNKTTQYQ